MSAKKADDERRERLINLIGEGEIEKGLQLAKVEDIDFLFAIGYFFWEEKVFDLAEKVYTRIIQLDSGDADVWYNKGLALGNLGKYEEALECYDEAIRIDPDYAKAWSNKGVTLGNLGKYEEELECYDEAIRIDPDYADAWSNKGVALGNLGKYEEELECYDEAIRIDPDYADAWYNKGLALGNLGKYEEALECYDEAIRIDPGYADAWYNKGLALGNLGKYEEALECYDEAIRIDPGYADAWSNKGLALGNLGKYEEELQCYDEAIRIDPGYAKAWSNKGVTLGNLGKYEEALECFDEAIRIDPGYVDAWYNKGVALGNLGKYEEALECYDEAIRIDPHDADAYYNQGIAFLDSYQYKNAFQPLKKAKKLYLEKKSKKDVKEITGYLLWAQALHDWSKEEYKKALFHFRKSASIFKNLQFTTIADSLNLIIRIIPLDQQFLNALHVQNIPELKEKSSRVCKEIHELHNLVNEKDISPQVKEIIFAKANCFSALCDALEFKEPDFQKLNNARKTFERLEFDTSIVGVNSLDTIIRILSRYTCLEDIPDPIQHSLVQELDNLTVLDGALTGRIPIKKEYITPKSATKMEEPEIVYHFIDNTEKEWVRLCLVQLDFSVEYSHSGEFGYTLKEKEREKTRKMIFEALDIAAASNTDIICFPELSTAEEWVQETKKYNNLTIVFGTYYKNGFNTCPILVKGQDSYIQKINPSPQFETEVIQNKKMKKGKKIFVLQTKCGSFAVLICIDYLKEAHRILYNQDERIKNVDFIIVPAYNKDVIRFQRKGDTDCLEGNYPYIVQVNSLSIQGARAGGTCVIGTEHKDAVTRYKDLGLLSKNVSEYKLIETDKESIIVIDLDIKRKGVPVPATGPKMKVLQKYIYENGRWNSVDF